MGGGGTTPTCFATVHLQLHECFLGFRKHRHHR